MEKLSFEDTKEKKGLPDWLKKLRNYGLASTVALSSFLASCDNGPKERATLEDVKNHIENADFERVSPEIMKELKAKGKSFCASKKEKPDGYVSSTRTLSYSISENDSLIKVDHTDDYDFKGGFEAKFLHAEIDNKTGVIVYFNDEDHITGQVASSMYVIKKGGEIGKKNYNEGTAKAFVEKVVNDTKNIKNGDGR